MISKVFCCDQKKKKEVESQIQGDYIHKQDSKEGPI